MTNNNSADMRVILKALTVLVNGPDSVRALSGMTKHACSTWFPCVKYMKRGWQREARNPMLSPPCYRTKLALWYSPECKIIVLSITYVNLSTFQHPEKRVRQCARPLRSHSISLM